MLPADRTQGALPGAAGGLGSPGWAQTPEVRSHHEWREGKSQPGMDSGGEQSLCHQQHPQVPDASQQGRGCPRTNSPLQLILCAVSERGVGVPDGPGLEGGGYSLGGLGAGTQLGNRKQNIWRGWRGAEWLPWKFRARFLEPQGRPCGLQWASHGLREAEPALGGMPQMSPDVVPGHVPCNLTSLTRLANLRVLPLCVPSDGCPTLGHPHTVGLLDPGLSLSPCAGEDSRPLAPWSIAGRR